jgi:hypothetical protein
MKAPLPKVSTPTNVSHIVDSSTSATISWDAVQDTDVTYTVEVAKHRDIDYDLISSTNFVSDRSWAEAGSVNRGGYGEVYIGSYLYTGSLTSPSFTTDSDGVVTVIFSAKYYNYDESGIVVSLLDDSGNVIGKKKISLTSSYATYAVVFEGKANTKSKVRFECEGSKKRVYLRNADIYNGDATIMVGYANTRSVSDNMTFTDLTSTSITLTNLEEMVAYDCRVKAVPIDKENYAESAWSDKYQFTLSNLSGMSGIGYDSQSAVEYFNLQGVRINGTPSTSGIYIRCQGGKISKVLVR